jgi:hypothetical protein
MHIEFFLPDVSTLWVMQAASIIHAKFTGVVCLDGNREAKLFLFLFS